MRQLTGAWSFTGIIVFSVVSSVVYGILHDMITAHLCVEYFTIGHHKVIESESPVLLALVWGTIATWWVGLPLGILLAAVNHFGKLPSLSFREMRRLITRLMVVMFILAIVAGILGFVFTEAGMIHLSPLFAERMRPQIYSRFLAAGFSHLSSYLSGIIGALILCIIVYRRRKRIVN